MNSAARTESASPISLRTVWSAWSPVVFMRLLAEQSLWLHTISSKSSFLTVLHMKLQGQHHQAGHNFPIFLIQREHRFLYNRWSLWPPWRYRLHQPLWSFHKGSRNEEGRGREEPEIITLFHKKLRLDPGRTCSRRDLFFSCSDSLHFCHFSFILFTKPLISDRIPSFFFDNLVTLFWFNMDHKERERSFEAPGSFVFSLIFSILERKT